MGEVKAPKNPSNIHKEEASIKEAALSLGIKDTNFDRWINPAKMV